MKSLVSILWQLEIPTIQIFPTLLKNSQEKPHHYFFSTKQNRILRKKTPDAISLLQSSTSKDESIIISIIRMNKSQQLSVELIETTDCIEKLQIMQYQGQFCILPKNCYVILCRARKGHLIDIQFLIGLVGENFKSIIYEVVSKFVGHLEDVLVCGVDKMQGKNCGKKNGIVQMALLAAINWAQDQHSLQIFIIDAIILKFLTPNPYILDITYKAHMKPKFSDPSQPPAPSQRTHSNSQINSIHERQLQQKKDLKQIECKVCGELENQINSKQISNEEFKSIRKAKNLIIRGFNEQYYQVCYACYSMI